jgi:hypothetical protein
VFVETETQPEDVTVPEPELDAPNQEPDAAPTLELEPPAHAKPPHPLHPGGVRFEQIYAQSKQYKRDLEHERELRLAAEAKLSQPATTQASPTNAPAEYTWEQLEGFIKEGRISLADANAHREQVLLRSLKAQVKDEYQAEIKTNTRVQTLTSQLNEYVGAIPAILQEDSPERARLDAEFDWLVSVQDRNPSKMSEAERKALQLTALRNVYGPIDSVAKQKTSLRTETQQERAGGSPPSRKVNPDQELLNKLTRPQIEHYEKMFRAGRYPGKWKDVVEELKFTPKAR